MQPDLPEPQDNDVPDAAASPAPNQTESVPLAGAEGTGTPAAGGAERRRRRNRRRGKGGSKGGAVAGDSDAADAMAGQQILAGSESESAPQPARAANAPRAGGAKQTREVGGKSSRGARQKAPRTPAPNDAAAATDNLPGAVGDDHKLQKLLAEAGLGGGALYFIQYLCCLLKRFFFFCKTKTQNKIICRVVIKNRRNA